MSATATQALRLAQHLIDAIAASNIDGQGIEIDGQIHSADDIRSVLGRGLESLRQGPAMLDAIEVHRRLMAASRKAGSDAALARQISITRQSLLDERSTRTVASRLDLPAPAESRGGSHAVYGHGRRGEA